MLLYAFLLTGWLHASSGTTSSSRYVRICRWGSPQYAGCLCSDGLHSNGDGLSAARKSHLRALNSRHAFLLIAAARLASTLRPSLVCQVAFVETEWDTQVAPTAQKRFSMHFARAAECPASDSGVLWRFDPLGPVYSHGVALLRRYRR
jgi:hypothetical protein